MQKPKAPNIPTSPEMHTYLLRSRHGDPPGRHQIRSRRALLHRLIFRSWHVGHTYKWPYVISQPALVGVRRVRPDCHPFTGALDTSRVHVPAPAEEQEGRGVGYRGCQHR